MGRRAAVGFLAGVLLSAVGWAEADKAFSPPPCDYPVDGGFESGWPNSPWTETTDGLTVITQSSFLARTGDWLAVFGGQAFVPLAQSLEQSIYLPAGPAILSYYIRIPDASTDEADFIRVLVDEQVLAEYTIADATEYSQFRLAIHDLSAFADDDLHSLKIESFVSGSPVTSFHIDDLRVNTCSPGDNLFLYSVLWRNEGRRPEDLVDAVGAYFH